MKEGGEDEWKRKTKRCIRSDEVQKIVAETYIFLHNRKNMCKYEHRGLFFLLWVPQERAFENHELRNWIWLRFFFVCLFVCVERNPCFVSFQKKKVIKWICRSWTCLRDPDFLLWPLIFVSHLNLFFSWEAETFLGFFSPFVWISLLLRYCVIDFLRERICG